MSVGGVVVDVVKVNDSKWWVDTIDRSDLMHGGRTVAVFVDPKGEPIDVGDSLWWQGDSCFWTPSDRSREDVRLPKIGFSGVSHPDLPRCHICGKRATCLGEYETCTGNEQYACDDCCAHGNEDGHCRPLAVRS